MPLTPLPADYAAEEAETVLASDVQPARPSEPQPPVLEPAPIRAHLPSLEPSMDDWDDVPTRIESLATLRARAEEPSTTQPAPLYTSPPPGVDLEAETMVNPEAGDLPPVDAPPPPPMTATPPPAYDDPDATAILSGSGEDTAILPESPPPYAPDQPPPPAGPVPRVPSDAEPKKSKLPLIAGGCVGFMLLCMGCGGGVFFFRGPFETQLADGFEIPELPADLAEVDVDPVLSETGAIVEADILEVAIPEDPQVPEVEVPEDPVVVEVEDPVAPDGPVISFHTDLDGIKKLKVSCTGASGEGVEVAHVALESAEKCQITAYMKDRSRHSAVVTAVGSGDYHCFVDGEATCEP